MGQHKDLKLLLHQKIHVWHYGESFFKHVTVIRFSGLIQYRNYIELTSFIQPKTEQIIARRRNQC